MYDNIYKIREIRDNIKGEDEVNNLLQKGWILLSVCQVSNPDTSDIVYVLGITKDAHEMLSTADTQCKHSKFSELLPQSDH